ncbi:hypothetical protein [Brevibacillus sp. NRS-1366]|uniref:hypothetical protein n=1 Tax=Brevibacillus sp. NRS-1366 TaxID=3233899 RepID=UPI003D192505
MITLRRWMMTKHWSFSQPVAVLRAHNSAPRVLMANANLVSSWSKFDRFLELEQRGMMANGMFTAGYGAYIGTQGILQGTYGLLRPALLVILTVPSRVVSY